MKLTWLLLIPAFVAVALGNDGPDIARTTKIGCIVQGTTEGRWSTDVWADYGPESVEGKHDWVKLQSVRNNQSQALMDCGQWLEQLKKKLVKK